MVPLIAGDFNNDALNQHNYYRQKHGCPGLQLHSTLNDYAQWWADYMAYYQYWDHSNGDYGENLYKSKGYTVVGRTAVDEWYKEEKNFDYNNPNSNDLYATGHFTQLVWKSSNYVGFGKATDSNGYTYVVAEYYPPGNYQGEYAENVPPPKWFGYPEGGRIAFPNVTKLEIL